MPPPSVNDDMFESMAFNAGAGSGLGKSTSYRSFSSLGGGGLDHNSVQSRESVVGVLVTTGPSLVLVLLENTSSWYQSPLLIRRWYL